MLMSQPVFVGALRSNRPIRRRLINGDVRVVIKGVKVVGEMKNFDFSKGNDLWVESKTCHASMEPWSTRKDE